MKRVVTLSAILIALVIQWHAHYLTGSVGFWSDTFPILVVAVYLITKGLENE